jgi:small subunit ribosomal protein S11
MFKIRNYQFKILELNMSDDIKKIEEKEEEKTDGKIDKKIDLKKDLKDKSVKKKEKDEKEGNDNPLGLEELPEEIRKKMEKKKAERDQKTKPGKSRKKKKKATRKVNVGKAYIKATYNNTIVTITDLQGNVISWASAGIAGFKGPKKSTPYAASIITRLAVGKAREEFNLSEVSVFVRGVGTGRESAVRALNSNGLIITSIQDITPVPHNGCRAKKPRRV